MKRTTWVMAALLLGAGIPAKSGELPEIRGIKQLAEEAKIWVAAIEGVKKSGKRLAIKNDGGKTATKRLKEALGPYVPLERIKSLILEPDGTFHVKFKKKHMIDVPLAKTPGFIRVIFRRTSIDGELLDTTLVKTKKRVKVLAFHEPHSIGIDKLDGERESTIPGIGKMLGLVPNIICFILIEDKDGLRVAPQLNGMGMVENSKLIKDLLKVDDTLLPESLLVSSE